MNLTFARFALLLAIVLVICLWPSVLGGKVFVPLDLLWQCPPHTPPPGVQGVHNSLIGDMLYESFAWKTLLQRCAAQGEWPLWNPYAFCGHPLYATGQASTFYPFNLIFLLVPLPYACVVFTALHLWLGGVFQYLLCRRLGLSGFGSAVGGIVFALCGFFAMRLIWPTLLGSAVWLPLMLICIAWLAESHTRAQAARRVAASAVVFALPLLSGFLEIAFHAYFTAGLFTIAQCGRLFSKERSVMSCLTLCGRALAVVVLAVMLAAPQLLPFMEVTARNTRVDEADYDKMVGRALKPEHLLPVIMPDSFGNPAKHRVWDLRTRRMVPVQAKNGEDCYSFGSKNYSENGYYLGLLPLALAALSLRVRGHHRWFFWALLAISLAMAFGTRLYAIFWHTVPGFTQVRTPFRWMYPATFAVASLAAIGAEWWRQRFSGPRSRVIPFTLLAGPLTLLVVLLVLLAWPEPLHHWAARVMERFPRLTTGPAFADAWDAAGFYWANLFRFALFALAAAVILALPGLRAWGRRGAAIAGLACLALLAVDAGQANSSFMTHADPAWLDRVPPSIKFLQDDPDVFRIARFGRQVVLHPNLATLYGLHDVAGYDSIILRDYARYLGAIERQRSLWWNQIVGFVEPASLDSPLLGLLNIRYLLTHVNDGIDHPDWELVFDDGMRIYRNRREWPRAFMVHQAQTAGSFDEAVERLATGALDPRAAAVVVGPDPQTSLDSLPAEPPAEPGRVNIARYARTRVELDTSAQACGIAVLCDMMYPGWRVYVDDRPAEILQVDGIFRGVCVPTGEHRVSFRFEPASLRRGVWLLTTGLGVVVGLLVVPLVTRGAKTPLPPPVLRHT